MEYKPGQVWKHRDGATRTIVLVGEAGGFRKIRWRSPTGAEYEESMRTFDYWRGNAAMESMDASVVAASATQRADG